MKPVLAAYMASSVLLLAGVGLAHAETIPERSTLDSRIQVVRNYNGDIITVYAAEGIQTTIEIKDDTIVDFAMGDRDAWKAKFINNRFVMKPHAPQGDTNLTLFGQKRAYLFKLYMLKRETPKVAYLLTVEQPKPVPVLTAGGLPVPSPEQVAAENRAREQQRISKAFGEVPYQGRLNYEYWIVGPSELQPVAAHDNGTFTYLTFSAANPLPIATVLEPDGTESLPDFHMDGQTMVLHRVATRILLRRGQLVAGVSNRAIDRPGQASATGTTSDKVDRVIPRRQGGQ